MSRFLSAFSARESKLTLSVQVKTLATVLAIVFAVTLPQLAHLIGASLGVGNAVGAVLLPMHLPVLFVGFLAGPIAGGIAGTLAPCISFMLSGMPTASVLPLMMIELAAYGILCGAMRSVKMPLIAKLLIAQLVGRMTRLLLTLALSSSFAVQSVSLGGFLESVWQGMPGLLLQWLLIPILLYKLEKHAKREN